MIDTEYIISRLSLKNRPLNIFLYGSVVYGTYIRGKSDIDVICITDERTGQYSDNMMDVTFYSPAEFQERLNIHEINALECFFLPPTLKLIDEHEYIFKLDLSLLRHSISQKSSNSFVKAKKKLTIEKDYDLRIGLKSLFHSIRLLMFGKQIAKHGYIIDYSEANTLYYDIMSISDWEEAFSRYKAVYNKYSSEFRLTAPK